MAHAMDKLPEDWLFVTLNEIKDAQRRHAAEMRLGFDEMKDAQRSHEIDDAKVESRVRALEQVNMDRKDAGAVRRSIEIVFIATGVNVLYETAKHYLGVK